MPEEDLEIPGFNQIEAMDEEELEETYRKMDKNLYNPPLSAQKNEELVIARNQARDRLVDDHGWTREELVEATP